MKTQILFLTLVMFVKTSNAQSITEQVDFDNSTDQSVYFYGVQSLVQVPNFGVTGGCLYTPDSINWGNDNSIYCSKYESVDSIVNSTQLRFLYWDVLSNFNSFDRAASIWLRPHADPNHYIIGSVTHDRKLEILSYSTSQSSFPISLINNHWYKLQLTTMKISNVVNVTLRLSDMGTVGTSIVGLPITENVSISDSLFAHDNAIEVSIIGSKASRGFYIDNFVFSGAKSPASCPGTGIYSPEKSKTIRLIHSNNFIHVVSDETYSYFELFEMSGQILKKGQLNDHRMIDITALKAGIYLLRFDGMSEAVKFGLQ